MKTHRRAGVVTATLVLAGIGLLGLAGCTPTAGSGSADPGAADAGSGPAGIAAPPVEDAAAIPADVDGEAQVLAAVGFENQLEPSPAAAPTAPGTTPSAGPDPSAGPGGERRAGSRKRHAARVLLRKNTLHGEAVVQTKNGRKTIVVQRGTVTAISDTSLTLKSADGFTLTWTYGDKLHVVEHRTRVQPEAIKVGDVIGVAGRKDAGRTLARLIVKR